MKAHPRHVLGQTNRLRVFAYLQKHMEAFERCPTAAEAADALGMRRRTVRAHMRALDGADGLPLPVPGGVHAWQESLRRTYDVDGAHDNAVHDLCYIFEHGEAL